MVSNAICANCQAPLPAEARVCPKCGTPVAQADAPAPDQARADVPAAWAAFAPAATSHAGSNGSAPVAEPAAANEAAAVPAGETIAPLESTAALPVRPAGSLVATRADTTLIPTVEAPATGAPGRETGPLVDSPAPGEPVSPAPFVPAPVAAAAPVVPVAVAAAPVVAAPVVAAAVPAPVVAPAPAVPAAPPTGALVLLRGEEVLMQLGALYLTNKRAILYAPTILRSAFLRDIDAVGTITERSSGWMLLFGLLGLGLAAVAAYVGLSQPGFEFKLGEIYSASPALLAIPLALIGVVALASYFFWIKRSLFLSVGGRPLIVVSISGWSGKKLTAVDSFVNAFSQAKESDNSRT